MPGQVGVKTRSLSGRSKCCYESKVVEKPECPINRIQGYGWHSLSDSPKDRLCIWMVSRLSHLPEDLYALMSETNTCVMTRLLETLYPLIDFSYAGFHPENLIRNHS